MALEDAGNVVETRQKYELRKNQKACIAGFFVHVSIFNYTYYSRYSPIQASIICLFNGVHCRQRKQNFSPITEAMYFRALPECPNFLKDGRADYKSFLCVRHATSAVRSVSMSPRSASTVTCISLCLILTLEILHMRSVYGCFQQVLFQIAVFVSLKCFFPSPVELSHQMKYMSSIRI